MGKKNKEKTIKIAGQKFNIGNKLGAGEIRKIAAATDKSVAQVASKASNAGVKTSSAAQNVIARASAPTPPPPSDPSLPSGPLAEQVFYSTDTGGGGGGMSMSLPEFQAAQTAAELQTRSQISNYGWDAQKAMENIRQAAETERLKYEVDNRIPVVQEEAKGKIDLQKIVNAGLENVTRIERGADMMRSITSMFNF